MPEKSDTVFILQLEAGRLARAECCRHTLNSGERGAKEKRLSSEREKHEEEEGVVVYRRRYSALLRRGLLQKKGRLVVDRSIVCWNVWTITLC
jgi:hypothetical protein